MASGLGAARRGLSTAVDGRGVGCRAGPLDDEADHVLEGGEVAQLQVVVAGDAVGLAHGGEQLGLLDRVDAEVGFEIEVEVEHVLGVAGLLGHQGEHLLAHVVLVDPGRR